MTILSQERAIWLAEQVLPHEPAMRAWLRRKPVDDLEVDDIIQETYAILAARESVADIRNPRNYAFQTAFSIVQTHLRRARIVSFRSVGDFDLLGATSDAPSPEREAVDREELRLVEAQIAALPSRCREVIVLRRVHDLSYREIAERLHISENTVEKLVSKALRLLMDAFGGGRAGPEASIGAGESDLGKFSKK